VSDGGGAAQVLSLPKGGGALAGIGETFAPNVQTGTGNLTVPITLPAGRHGFAPSLNLAYSTGAGNGPFGLGWSLGVPGVSRKTTSGVPLYDDARDTFILSGSEDLVPVPAATVGWTAYRPRTEGLFARIARRHDAANDYWEVRSRDGLVSLYGTPTMAGHDPAVVADPDDRSKVFAWNLTRTSDPFGNRIEYVYERDTRQTDGPHHWDHLYLAEVRYGDYGDPSAPAFLIDVRFTYLDRPDPFSDYRAGFEQRTVRRCAAIDVTIHAGVETPARTYHLRYLDESGGSADQRPPNGVSLLASVRVEGHDGAVSEQLPPLEFEYSRFTPERRALQTIAGPDLAPDALTRPGYDLADLRGNGLPDLVQIDGAVRYWRNQGDGRFDRMRTMDSAPAGLSLADSGVQLLDADGDGRLDLLVSTGELSGYYPLQWGGAWDRRSFQRQHWAPSFDLKDPAVHLVDLDGDGVTDAIRSGTRLECFFNSRDDGWRDTLQMERRAPADFPNVDFSDARVKWADMTGDGLQDIALVQGSSVAYWPALGRGRWGVRVDMRGDVRFPDGYDPRHVLLGDADGDGLADLVLVGDTSVTLWVNRGGNGWSAPITIDGTPSLSGTDVVRVTDVLGTGVGGLLWSSAGAGAATRSGMSFLDFIGGAKPYLLTGMTNGLGTTTHITYAPSTVDYLRDEQRPDMRWRTPLPFPVHVVTRVEVDNAFSHGATVTTYAYHHGYWDGAEREFRGFGRVDQYDAETFAPGDPALPPAHYSPPTETRTWFHQGPVEDASGAWAESDYSGEYWSSDAQTLVRAPDQIAFLASLPRRVRRDALRALRGRVLRTELYARDGSARQGRPYTVTEHLHSVMPLPVGDPWPAQPEAWQQRVFYPYTMAERTTQWERGDEPLTSYTWTTGYDAYGQPVTQVSVAVPRGRDVHRGGTATPGEPYLVTTTDTAYAHRDDAQHYIVDRVAGVTRQEILASPSSDGSVPLATLLQAIEAGTAPRRIVEQTFRYYDGPAFEGLPLGQVGDHGALVRTASLIFTPAILDAAYGPDKPPYLVPGAPPAWGADYPLEYQALLPARAGYNDGPDNTTSPFVPGYYVATERRRYDVHDGPAGVGRGLVTATRDPLGHDTTIAYDAYALLPAVVTAPNRLLTVAAYDYRVLQVKEMTEPNGNRTRYAYTPLGLLASIAVMGKTAEAVGDTDAQPGTRLVYDTLAFVERERPVSARTIRRVYHATDASIPVDERDATIESIAYSDGRGRLLQTRTQAEDVAFGDTLHGDASLAPMQSAPSSPAVGRGRGPADPPRVVVSGWQVYDNKGRAVEKYEPFYSAGWDYAAPGDDARGQKAVMAYDPRGHVVRTVNPDGSEQRVVYGVPSDIANPDLYAPTPWDVYTYDANDNAGRTHAADATSYRDHWNTPASVEVDALGRTVRAVERNGVDPAAWYTTRSIYDIRGNLLEVTDQLGRRAFRHVYDLASRLLWSEQLDGGARRTVYDAAGRVVEQRDDKGALRLHAYDIAGRATRLWARDVHGEPVTLRERLVYGDAPESGLSPSQAVAGNLRGRLYRHYDEAGLLTIAACDFKGNALERARQVIADTVLLAPFTPMPPQWRVRPARVAWQPAPGATLEAHAEAVLDAAVYQTSLGYDGLNRVRRLRYPADVTGARKELQPRYNQAGALERVDLDGATYVERIAYNAKGQRTLIALGNGMMTRYAYDPTTFRLVRLRTEHYSTPAPLTYQPAGAALQDYAYEYDLSGNVRDIHDRAPGAGYPGGALGPDALDRAFTYDPLYRLLAASGRQADIPAPAPWDDAPRPVDPTRTRPYTERYHYDPTGNLTMLRQESSAAFTRMLTLAPNSNRLATLTVGTTPYAYSYDANGNMVSEGASLHFEWDHADHLRAYRTQTDGAEPTVYAQYLYDAGGERVKKLVRKQGGQVEVTVYIDGFFEHRSVVRAGKTVENNNILHVMDNTTRIALVRAGSFSQDPAPAIQYHLGDHLGSSVAVIDEKGTKVNREEYTPYGETSFGSFAHKRYRYTGKERDEESGLYYHGARYYVPWLARWASGDPADHERTLAGLFYRSSYVYVEDRPLGAVDPDGQVINFVAAGIGAAAGALIGGGLEAGRQIWREGKVSNWTSVGASAAGGAVSGGLAGLTMGASLLVEAGAAGVANVAGGATTRAITGQEQNLRASTHDFVVGVLTFGIVRGGSTAIKSFVSEARGGLAAEVGTARPASSIVKNARVGGAGEEMAEHSLKNAHPNFRAASMQKFTLKDASGKTVYAGAGRSGSRLPDAMLPTEGGAFSPLEIKTLQNPIDPLDFARTDPKVLKQLANQQEILSRGATFTGSTDTLKPVVAGEGPGVTTGYWQWNPPKQLQ